MRTIEGSPMTGHIKCQNILSHHQIRVSRFCNLVLAAYGVLFAVACIITFWR